MSGLRDQTSRNPDVPAEAQISSVLRVLSSGALAPIHPRTGHGILHPPTPRCRSSQPQHHLRSERHSDPPHSCGDRPPKVRCPHPQPQPFLPGGRLLVPNWGQGGGTLAVRARLAHPSLTPEAVPSLPTRQYLVRFQLCSVAYERHVPPSPAAAQKPSRELTADSVSPLRAQPSASEGGPGRPRLPAGSWAGPERS